MASLVQILCSKCKERVAFCKTLCRRCYDQQPQFRKRRLEFERTEKGILRKETYKIRKKQVSISTPIRKNYQIVTHFCVGSTEVKAIDQIVAQCLIIRTSSFLSLIHWIQPSLETWTN
jgi:hypothetical protein